MKCVSPFSEAFSSHSSPIGAESASFFFLARPSSPKSAEHSGKNGQLFCKTGALSSKSCLVFLDRCAAYDLQASTRKRKWGKKEKKGSTKKTERAVSSKEAQQSQIQTTPFVT
jgi:hypothetical protein